MNLEDIKRRLREVEQRIWNLMVLKEPRKESKRWAR